jgi:nicotinamidase-related amidase
MLATLVLCATTFQVATFAQEENKEMNSVEPKSALVVVDAQVGVLESVWDAKRIVGNIEALVGKARSSGTPVLWVQHSDQELKYGSVAWNLASNFKPAAGEYLIQKKYNSSFAETDLEVKLKQLGVKRLVLAGAATNWCLRATAYSAIDRGYNIVIVSDAHSTTNLEPSKGRLIPAADIIEEFNSVMRWISAPNVRVDLESTSEVTF